MSYLYQRWQLIKKPAFAFYLLSCLIATFGTGMSYVAMTWLVLDGKHDVFRVTILMLCFWLPNVVLSPIAGVLVDRYSRKSLIIISNVIRGFILIIFGLYLETNFVLNDIFYMGLLLGSFFSLYWPATVAFIREIVSPDDLLYANATIDTAYEIGNIIGMGSAGFFIALLSAQATFIINGILFFSSVVLLFFVKHHHKMKQSSKSWFSFLDDIKNGLVYLKNRRTLIVIYTVQLILLTQYMVTPILIAPFAKNYLHATVTQFGAIEAALSVGVVIGGLLLPWLSEKWSHNHTVTLLNAIAAVMFTAFSFNRNILVAGMIYFVIGISVSTWALVMTKAQDLTDLKFQGRVQSTFNSLSGVLVLATYLAVSGASNFISLPHLYFIETAFSLSIVAIMLFSEV